MYLGGCASRRRRPLLAGAPAAICIWWHIFPSYPFPLNHVGSMVTFCLLHGIDIASVGCYRPIRHHPYRYFRRIQVPYVRRLPAHQDAPSSIPVFVGCVGTTPGLIWISNRELCLAPC